MLRELNAVAAIGFRDFLKFTRDRSRLIFTFVFPIVFVGVLGTSLKANVSDGVGYDFVTYTFTGVLAQTLFQAAAFQMIRLQDERDEDLSQEIFVSPISRYSIIVGKILGGGLIAVTQVVGILLFGLLLGVEYGAQQLLALLAAFPVIVLLGGGFGVMILSLIGSEAATNQIFPLLMFPQFFLAGVFSPIQQLPIYLLIPSRAVPMTYAVDFFRGLFFLGTPEHDKIVLFPFAFDLLVIAGFLLVFLPLGTYLWVRRERNK